VTLRGAAFDLDDTLYLERDYVVSGFDSVAQQIAMETKLDRLTVLNELMSIHDTGHRGRVFDAWLAERPMLKDKLDVASLVESYRIHEPRISLLPGVASMLETLRKFGLKLGLVTDGFLKGQRTKVAALGLADLIDRIVFTDEWGPNFWKPNSRAFELLETEWVCDPGQLVYVADNPAKDFIGPKARGWLTVRLRTVGQLWGDAEAMSPAATADLEVATFEALQKLLVEKAMSPEDVQIL
jgi:putative hydrolase of the HAD superfamily